MTPYPWLQFDPIRAPELPRKPGALGAQLGSLAAAGVGKLGGGGSSSPPGPPMPGYQTMSAAQRAQSAGVAANAEAGPPPPVPMLRRRIFPNPMQQQQLDEMR